jgi:hypothetical protein
MIYTDKFPIKQESTCINQFGILLMILLLLPILGKPSKNRSLTQQFI